MHMADALISPVVGATFWTGSLVSLAFSARRLKSRIDERLIPLMGVLAAFIFAAQMINFTIPGTGASGHLGGGMILAITLGPHAGFIAVASVLIIQSLFFADGGILALGCNIWNLGVYPCFLAYPFIYRKIVAGRSSPRMILIASLISVAAGLQFGALSVVLQTVSSGRSELSFFPFSAVMLPIHLAIGLVEGFVTAGVINYILRVRPDVLENSFAHGAGASQAPRRNFIVLVLCIALLAGGILSWFSSSNPDGLEWSIRKVTGTNELPERPDPVSKALGTVQGKTSVLPDYSLKTTGGPGQAAAPDVSGAGNPGGDMATTTLSGIVGALLVLLLIAALGLVVKLFRRKDRYS